jgi:hypothetical protein
MSRAERRPLRALWTNANVTVLTAYKGNAAVVFTPWTTNKRYGFLGALLIRDCPRTPTEAVEWKTALLLKLSSPNEMIMKQLWSQGSRPPRLY